MRFFSIVFLFIFSLAGFANAKVVGIVTGELSGELDDAVVIIKTNGLLTYRYCRKKDALSSPDSCGGPLANPAGYSRDLLDEAAAELDSEKLLRGSIAVGVSLAAGGGAYVLRRVAKGAMDGVTRAALIGSQSMDDMATAARINQVLAPLAKESSRWAIVGGAAVIAPLIYLNNSEDPGDAQDAIKVDTTIMVEDIYQYLSDLSFALRTADELR